MVHDNQHGAMDKDTIQRSTRNRQAHPRRDPADLRAMGERAGLAHVGSIAQEIVDPILRRRRLEVVRGSGKPEREDLDLWSA